MSRGRTVLAGECFWGMQDLIRKLPPRGRYGGADRLLRSVS
jgi:hypothetical protein